MPCVVQCSACGLTETTVMLLLCCEVGNAESACGVVEVCRCAGYRSPSKLSKQSIDAENRLGEQFSLDQFSLDSLFGAFGAFCICVV